ncbi:MAG TPA: FHA domain-containing protein [Rhodothermales bacterium]|nr:FHA domain-containing protein [Rhodothermales bacterium]
MTGQTEAVRKEKLPPVWVSGGGLGTPSSEVCLSEPFCIGRDESCRICLDSGQVSRKHAEVTYADGAWWIKDLGSTNGMFVDGQRIDRVRIEDAATVEFGRNGPALHFVTKNASPAEKPAKARSVQSGVHTEVPAPAAGLAETIPPERAVPRAAAGARPYAGPQGRRTKAPSSPSLRKPPRPPASDEKSASVEKPASIEKYVEHYFGPRDGPVGDHTMMIRQAYQIVQRQQHRTYVWLILAVGVVCLAALGYAGYQHVRLNHLQERAVVLFNQMRDDEARFAKMRIVLEASHDQSLDAQLRELEERQEAKRREYDAYVDELGIRRPLNEEEQVIYKVARIFNESEVSMPADFIRTVRQVIHGYWQQEGRQTLIIAIERAEERGYTPYIVHTFQKYGLPPEFFYLALQESAFDPTVSGPRTNWGIAKGMWQFIPDTGEAYGLRIGPREDFRVYDPEDERQDMQKSTDAAARYILDIYGKLAHASGLLAMASYNWGERRVVSKLEVLMDGIPDTPEARSYWRFYNEYKDRMPEETRQYVIKIFAAAVIGENPRLFGFDFDNPLARYIDAPDTVTQRL